MKTTEYTNYNDVEIVTLEQIFDENNNIVEDINYDEEGHQILKVINEYNQENQLVKQVQLDENNELIEEKNFTYLDGKPNEIHSHFPDGSTSTEKYLRNNDKVEIITEDEDGEFEGSLQHILNEKGLTKELIRTNFMNKVDTRLQYEYNEQGLLTQVTEQDAKGRFIRAYGYKYDASGNRITEDELNKKGKLTSRIVHKYENEKLISTITAASSKHFHYEGDKLIKEEQLNPDGSADIIEYEYQEERKLSEKHYNVPHGDNIAEGFLVLSKRYTYE
jgi:YD repeat-containing protein